MQIVFPFSGADIGGSHVATYALAGALRKHYGYDCTFLVAAGTPIAEEAARLGFRVVDSEEFEAAHWAIRKRRSPLYAFRRLPARVRVLRALGAQCLIHCNDIADMQSYGLIAKALGHKVLYQHHALNRMILPNRILIGLSDSIVAVSEVCRQSLGVLGRNAHVVLNPIEVPVIDRSAVRKRLATDLGIDGDKLWLGFVGNFWRRKRPEFFLETAARILSSEPRAHFILFGRKGDYESAELQAKAAALSIADSVTFAGFLMPPEDNIAAIDMMLAPAIDEPFGRTPIEAALLGTPYVATDDAGHAEIGARWPGGTLVPLKASPEEFAGVVLDLLRRPDAVKLSTAQRESMAADFALPAHAAAFDALYRGLEA